jgi:hypothetical protein
MKTKKMVYSYKINNCGKILTKKIGIMGGEQMFIGKIV